MSGAIISRDSTTFSVCCWLPHTQTSGPLFTTDRKLNSRHMLQGNFFFKLNSCFLIITHINMPRDQFGLKREHERGLKKVPRLSQCFKTSTTLFFKKKNFTTKLFFSLFFPTLWGYQPRTVRHQNTSVVYIKCVKSTLSLRLQKPILNLIENLSKPV